jgi:transglutaminase-like putative cysteine protease
MFGAVTVGLGLHTGCTSSTSNAPEVRAFRFTHSVAVDGIPETAQEFSLWVPVPSTDRWQIVRNLEVSAPSEYTITRESEYGNSMIYLSLKAPLPSRLDLQFEVMIERQGFNVMSEDRRLHRDDKPEAHDLEPHELVPIDGVIAELARDATKGSTTQLEKARAIYDYVTDTMTYDKSGEGWGRGDALFACDSRTGNCTDFHSLIIGMARSCGIPARFVMGFSLPEDRVDGEIPGYHCWAEMYIDGIGWFPVDSSEASKHPEKRAALFGGLDANRVQFTLGRDLELEPQASELQNYFVYPYVEVDGVTHAGVSSRISFLDVTAGK